MAVTQFHLFESDYKMAAFCRICGFLEREHLQKGEKVVSAQDIKNITDATTETCENMFRFIQSEIEKGIKERIPADWKERYEYLAQKNLDLCCKNEALRDENTTLKKEIAERTFKRDEVLEKENYEFKSENSALHLRINQFKREYEDLQKKIERARSVLG